MLSHALSRLSKENPKSGFQSRPAAVLEPTEQPKSLAWPSDAGYKSFRYDFALSNSESLELAQPTINTVDKTRNSPNFPMPLFAMEQVCQIRTNSQRKV
jgi:hypothetical protein